MFLIGQMTGGGTKMPELSFNPLNQVYVFNKFVKNLVLDEKAEGFNPLNQVYVFNHADGTVCMHP